MGASARPGFCTSIQVSNPQLDEPSGRNQFLAGRFTPMELCASGEAAPVPVHVIVRSTAIALVPSRLWTLVEKSCCPRRSAGLRVVWLIGGRFTACLTSGLSDGM